MNGEHADAVTFEATEMIALGLIVLAAHMGGRVCRRLRLSEVTGQILGGALVGPLAILLADRTGVDHAVYDRALDAFHFFVFVFLGMVAFGIGEELHISRLRSVGRTAFVVALTQSVLSFVLISGAFYFLADTGSGQPLLDALLIGAIGISSAPAVTFVLMNQLRVEGRMRHVLGGVVVLSDLADVLSFAIVLQIALRSLPGASTEGSTFMSVVTEFGMATALGAGICALLFLLVRRRAMRVDEDEEKHGETPMEAAFLHRILAEHPSPSAEILLIVLGAVSVGTGIAYLHEWPFLITAMVGGFLVANLHSHAIFDSLKIDHITSVFNLGFFALVGASISLDINADALWLVGLYILTRLIGKLAGGWIGCRLVGEDRKMSACLPPLLLPQAGVGAVEAVYASAVLGRPDIAAVVLPAIIFFEIVGVYVVDRTLRRWRTWVTDEEAALKRPVAASGRVEAARRLLGYLHPQFAVLDIQGQNKHDVIESLVDHARSRTQQHIDRAQALQLLAERERLSPTGFGHGIAIPHCRLMGLEKPVIVLARLDKGVVFGGVDDQPCDLILLILSSARDPGEHLKLLAGAGHVLGDEKTRALLRAAPDREAFLDVLRQIAE